MSVLQEIKFLLSNILNSKDKSLRKRTLEDAMELMSETELDFTMAEEALKFELKGKIEKANELIERILKKIDEIEFEE